ncbi:ATP-binding protein [Rheinheimera baltica]|uniref:histidine kinase n=2 Tax=Rheinheimera baltica TaxID=67576 RepID=A0ABT9I148_9GAMM|nr:ATP-binding protein [Rheinheimera baltica]MDP5137099.1 ATP-binding protein [Rheinheimera baltica]MDP5150673.1 ATP-binding protein [Rheinheimera baltica]
MQRLFWHFYLFIFLVLLGSGWAVEQLWQHWNPPAQQPWLASYTALLQQQLQQPASTWPDTIPLTILAQPADSISWLPDELAQLQQGNVISLFEAEKVYFYYLSNQQLLQLGPLTLVQNDGASWFTLLFFVLLAIAVAAWLWPVARDINSLQHSLTKFSVNIDTTLQLPSRSFIAPIAQSFQQMSMQIRELLKLQREMTQAVSHELRTPIARLSFALEMAQQLPEQERQLMLQDVRELQQLVDEILDYARLETGQIPLQMQQIDLTELIANVQEKLEPLPGAAIILQLPEHAVLYGDGHYLERALQNLLVNAKKYAVQHIRLRLSKHKQCWQFDIEDDGPGIPEHLRQEIFKPFFRVEASRNKKAGGFGLGLAIVQRVAIWHKGDIGVMQSTLGGAHFVLRLPQHP